MATPRSALCSSPIGNVLKIVTAGSAAAFVIFAISALVLRRRLDEQIKNGPNLR